MVRMKFHYAVNHASVHIRLNLESVSYFYPLYHQGVAFEFYLANCISLETTASSRNAPNFKGTPKRSYQSARCRGNNVVERGGVWLVASRRCLVMFSHLGMYPKYHWLFFGGKLGISQRSLFALDPDLRPVNDLTHSQSRSVSNLRSNPHLVVDMDCICRAFFKLSSEVFYLEFIWITTFPHDIPIAFSRLYPARAEFENVSVSPNMFPDRSDKISRH